VDLPPRHDLIIYDTNPAVSPDGRHVVFTMRHQNVVRLYVRNLDGFEVRALPGTEGGMQPFFSPDGTWVGFFAWPHLKKIPLAGGAPVTLATPPKWQIQATWGPDDQILIGGDDTGLWSLSSRGGTLVPLTRPDTAKGEVGHSNPCVLPDGRVLFAVKSLKASSLALYSPREKTWRPLQQAFGHHNGSLSCLPTGHVVLEVAGAMMAGRFDPAHGELTGPPVPVHPDTSGLAVSSSGTLAFIHLPKGHTRSLVLVDRTGKAGPAIQEQASYGWPRFSPDGRKVAVVWGESGKFDPWVIDLATGTRTRLRDEGVISEPVWTADGKKVIYSSGRAEGCRLYWQNADGSSTSELLHAEKFDLFPTSCSPDGKELLFYGTPPQEEAAIWAMPLAGERKARRLVARSKEGLAGGGARFSPDGRWIAYASSQTGRQEIYVQPYPALDARYAVSAEGGMDPLWGPDGATIYYRRGHEILAVDLKTSPTFAASKPRVLFEGAYWTQQWGDQNWDIAPDGERFVMIRVPPEARPQLRVATGWLAELERLAPGR
jgi:serine/threonine-protein kinase